MVASQNIPPPSRVQLFIPAFSGNVKTRKSETFPGYVPGPRTRFGSSFEIENLPTIFADTSVLGLRKKTYELKLIFFENGVSSFN